MMPIHAPGVAAFGTDAGPNQPAGSNKQIDVDLTGPGDAVPGSGFAPLTAHVFAFGSGPIATISGGSAWPTPGLSSQYVIATTTRTSSHGAQHTSRQNVEHMKSGSAFAAELIELGRSPDRQVVGRSTVDGEHLHLLAPGRVPPFQGRCGVPLEIHTLDYPAPGTHGQHLCDRCVQTLVPPTWPPAEDCA